MRLLVRPNPAPVASDADFEQAERELSGGPELDSKEELIEALPESERWDPVPGSRGTQAVEPPSEEEDDEGRNESAQLIDEGVHEAEHDQMLEAEKSASQGGKEQPVGLPPAVAAGGARSFFLAGTQRIVHARARTRFGGFPMKPPTSRPG